MHAGTGRYEGDDQCASSGELRLSRRDGPPSVVPGFLFENYDAAGTGPESLQAFIDACNGMEASAGVGARVGLEVVRVLDAMYRSARSGKPEAMR